MTEVKKLTQKEQEQKDHELQASLKKQAEELGKLYHTAVYPLFFVVPETGERVTGFVKEPTLMTKLMIMDKSMTNPVSTTASALPTCIVEEHSDKRLYIQSENPIDQALYIGAVMFVLDLVKRAQNQIKKN